MAKPGSPERKAREVYATQPERIQRAKYNSNTFIIKGDSASYVTTILLAAGRGLARHLEGSILGGVCTCRWARDHIRPEDEHDPKPYLKVDEACWHIRVAAIKVKEEEGV